VATALQESGGDALAIGVNAEPGLPAFRITSATPAEAVTKARTLIAQGRRLDLGLMQISVPQLHGLSLIDAFDACRNMATGAAHLAADYIWVLAHRRYQCGSPDCGVSYAAAVEARVVPPAPIHHGEANPFTKPAVTGRDLVFAEGK
jgi:hypothetical protein